MALIKGEEDISGPEGLQDALSRARTFIEAGDLAQALRWADRAKRQVERSEVVDELLARILLSLGRPAEAVQTLQTDARAPYAAAYEACLVQALRASGRADEAASRLQQALRDHAITGVDELANCARAACHGEVSRGWVGVLPDLTILIEVRCDTPDRLDVSVGGSLLAPFVEIEPPRGDASELRILTIKPPRARGLLIASQGGEDLLGSGWSYPPAPRMSGKVELTGGELCGWVRSDWHPGSTPELRVETFSGVGHPLRAPTPDVMGRYVFRETLGADLRRSGSSLRVLAGLPGGERDLLGGSPVIAPVQAAGRAGARPDLGWKQALSRALRPFSRPSPERFARSKPFEEAGATPDEAVAGLMALGQTFVLLITLDRAGGVARFVEQRCEALQQEGFAPIVLKPDAASGELRLAFPSTDAAWLAVQADGEATSLVALLRRLSPQGVELHHVLGHPEEAIEHILETFGLTRVYVHDYSWVCPRITLITGTGRYCGEPAVAACESCIAEFGSALGGDLSVAALRARSGRWLKMADQVIAPTRDVAERMKRHYPDLDVTIQPWEVEAWPVAERLASTPKRLKVALIGAIGLSKGFELLLACAQDAAARALPLDFTVIGYTADDHQALEAGVFVTGIYVEAEVAALLAREAPDIALFLSVWPETWCYALSHALRAKLPIVAFDLGAQAERLRAVGGACDLLPAASSPASVNEALLALALKRQRKSKLPLPRPRGPFSAATTPDVFQVGRRAPIASGDQGEEQLTMSESANGLSASVHLVTLKKGLYRFALQDVEPRQYDGDGDLALPAIQVAVAPGYDASKVEFMTGLRTEGAWLFDATDLLIAKVKTNDSAMLVTSYSAQGLTPLAIVVERIDQKRPRSVRIGQTSPRALSASAAIPGLAAPQARSAALPVLAEEPPRFDQGGRRVVRLRIDAHISLKGDMTFVDEPWAGLLGENLPIEGFSILPLEALAPEDLEYKGLTEKGVETPWTKAGDFCGTRQMNLQLSGFAIRLTGAAAERYSCRYRGSFRSGSVVGPVASGAPLRAAVLSDVLQAIEVSIVELGVGEPRDGTTAPAPAAPVEPAPQPRPVGPRFSVFREGIG